MTSFEEVEKKLSEMKQAAEGVKRLLILTHDNPDPDGISCALVLKALADQFIKVPAVVRFTGIVGRPENREMIRRLKIKVRMLGKNEIRPTDRIALLDCQPHTGNLTLPRKARPLIVIDHHPLRKTTKGTFVDVRADYGATATILAEYLLASAIPMTSQIATALCYGISSETQHLGRGATPVDAKIYSSLFAAANKKMLSWIENPKLPRNYYKTLNRALHQASVYKNSIITNLGEIEVPDFVPIVADLLLKCERISWSLCMGRYNNKILVSVRTTRRQADAGTFLRHLVGKRGTAGGHGMLAGGQVICESMADTACDQIEREMKARFLKKLGYEGVETVPLLIEESTKA